jgi:hypothetical protein
MDYFDIRVLHECKIGILSYSQLSSFGGISCMLGILFGLRTYSSLLRNLQLRRAHNSLLLFVPKGLFALANISNSFVVCKSKKNAEKYPDNFPISQTVGVPVPRILAKFIIFIELAQMIMGIAVNSYAMLIIGKFRQLIEFRLNPDLLS